MKKVLTAVVALLILGACATYQQERRYGAGGGGYYIAESPPSASYYYVPYWSLYGYGITPWWGYAYHSPYFYPHDFHVWYAPWPYYAAWPWYSPWYATHFHRYPPYGRHAPWPGRDPGNQGPVAPLPAYSGTPAVPPATGTGPWRLADDRDLPRELRYHGSDAGLPAGSGAARNFQPRTTFQTPAPVGRAGMGTGMSPGPSARAGAFGAPSAPAIGSRPAIGGRAGPALAPEPGPAPHHQ